jgi:hypothetical protein
VVFQAENYCNGQLGYKWVENLYCAANVSQLHGVKSLSGQTYNIFRLISYLFYLTTPLIAKII